MTIERIIQTGLNNLGKPYLFNATAFQTAAFDCSSFIQYIFYVNGVALPRNSRQQFTVGEKVAFKNIQIGDLLFFTTIKRKNRKGIEKIGHVAIYLGNDKILHTFRQGKKVKITQLSGYWQKKLVGVKRIL